VSLARSQLELKPAFLPRENQEAAGFIFRLKTGVQQAVTKPDPQPEVSVNWQRIAGEPSATWRRLWQKLLADRKGKSASTRRDPDDGELTNGSEQIVQDE